MPNSSPADRLHEAKRVYSDAYNNSTNDYRDAKTAADVKRIKRNLDAAEAAFINAGTATLDANGKAVEDAYKAAKSANDAVDQAREDAVALAARVDAVANAINKVKDLIAKAKS